MANVIDTGGHASVTEAAAVNDLALGIDRFGYAAYARALVAMLNGCEPPACVGLYAKWGSGKSFMIGQLKHFFDLSSRREPTTRGLVQWFEDGFHDLPLSARDAHDARLRKLLFERDPGAFAPPLATRLWLLFSCLGGAWARRALVLPTWALALWLVLCDAAAEAAAAARAWLHAFAPQLSACVGTAAAAAEADDKADDERDMEREYIFVDCEWPRLRLYPGLSGADSWLPLLLPQTTRGNTRAARSSGRVWCATFTTRSRRASRAAASVGRASAPTSVACMSSMCPGTSF